MHWQVHGWGGSGHEEKIKKVSSDDLGCDLVAAKSFRFVDRLFL